MRYITLSIIIALSISAGFFLTQPSALSIAGFHPPIVDRGEAWEPDRIYYDPAWRILPASWKSFIQPVPSATFTDMAADEQPCHEVLTTPEAADLAGEGWMQNEVSLAVSGSHVVVTFNDDNEVNRSNSISGFSYSTDGGKTFIDGGAFTPLNQYFGGGDPVITADPFNPDHFLYTQLTYSVQMRPDHYSPSTIVLHHSFDGGVTFPTDQSVDVLQGKTNPEKPSEPAISAKSFQDKEWMTYDPVNNTVFIAWSFFYDQYAFPAAIISHDGGETFDDPINLFPSDMWGGLVATASGPNGELYVVSNDFQSSRLLFNRSLDGGYTWEGPWDVTGVFQQPGFIQACGYYGQIVLKGGIRITSIPSMAVDSVTGDIYVVYNYMPETDVPNAQDAYNAGVDYANVAFTKSSDGGQTWTTPVTINDDGTLTDQFMPWVASTGNGNVAVMFYDRRNDPTDMMIDIYVARSFDGGNTWINNQRATCTSFPPAADAGCYMGDYIQMTQDGSNYYLAWGDNRDTINGQPNQDVYFTKLKAVPHIRPFNRPQ